MHPYCLATLCKLLARNSRSYQHLLTRLLIMANRSQLLNTYADLATAAATAWRNR